ncbi:MAG: hypothetical protein KJ626_01625 [Verrucomicrobia bacterium]|nr:hypothetical protein [Verrucomicrobiota bacterium]
MRRQLTIHGLVLSLAIAVNGVRAGSFETMAWYEIESRGLSGLGQRVFEQGKGQWIHARSDHFICHAGSIARIDEVLARAEYAYGRMSELLGLPDLQGRGHVFVIESREEWDRVMREAGAREEGIAVHVGRDMFVLRGAGEASVSILDVPHEMVHYRLHNAPHFRLPLWLEEGLALRFGWRVAKMYREKEGYQLTHEQPALGAEELISMRELLEAERYPGTQAEMRAFYRESSELVHAVWDNLTPDQFRAWIQATGSKGLNWAEALKTMFAFEDKDITAMLQRVEGRAVQSITE